MITKCICITIIVIMVIKISNLSITDKLSPMVSIIEMFHCIHEDINPHVEGLVLCQSP